MGNRGLSIDPDRSACEELSILHADIIRGDQGDETRQDRYSSTRLGGKY